MSKKSQKLLIILLCVVCFGAGVSVPVVLNKTTSADSKEREKFDTIYSILNSDWYYSNKVKNLDSKLMEQAITGMTTLDKDIHTILIWNRPKPSQAVLKEAMLDWEFPFI